MDDVRELVVVPGGDPRSGDVLFFCSWPCCYYTAPYDAAPNCTPFCGSPLSPPGARRPLPRCCSGLRPPVHGGRISQAWAVGEPVPRARPFASPARLPG